MAKDNIDKILESLKEEEARVYASEERRRREVKEAKKRRQEAEEAEKRSQEEEKRRQEEEKRRQEAERMEKEKEAKDEELRKRYLEILLSDDPELDSKFFALKGSVARDKYDSEEEEWIQRNSAKLETKIITLREKLLSEIAKIPYSFESIRGPYRHYDTKYIGFETFEIPKNEEMSMLEVEEKKKTIAALKLLAEKDDEDLDKKGFIRLIGKDIEITRRELVKHGINPQDLEWGKDMQISPSQIAQMDKEQNLTTREVGGVGRLLARIKEFFKGNGEK